MTRTVITSPRNPLLQQIRRAAQSGRPMEDGCLVLEGPNLLEEVLRSDWTVEQVLATSEALAREVRFRDVQGKLIEVSERALAAISGIETTQGVISLARPVAREPEDLFVECPLVLVLDGIQDPGNAGTLIRSAEAFGAAGVLACEGSVRMSNGKFLRASAGSIFRTPFVVKETSQEAISLLKSKNVNLFALDTAARLTIEQADLRHACAIVVGNEGKGISTAMRNEATLARIRVKGVESLNAAVAGSISLYEAARQRAAL